MPAQLATVEESEPSESIVVAWLGWLPLLVLPLLVLSLRSKMPPWAFMWLLAFAIYAGCKWQSFWSSRQNFSSARRALGYLVFWPGMDSNPFAERRVTKAAPALREWTTAAGKFLAGILLVFSVVRKVVPFSPLAAGWLGMIGATLVLHFGSFHLLALCWQSAGIAVLPIMQKPALSTSLSEFWGKRWNLGFRQLTHDLVFQPLRRATNARIALMASFIASGLIHDLVISVPAGAGYGWPTVYFVLQGGGVLLERSRFGRRIGLHRGIGGRLFALICVAAPLPCLFHSPFVTNVIVPFLHVLGAF